MGGACLSVGSRLPLGEAPLAGEGVYPSAVGSEASTVPPHSDPPSNSTGERWPPQRHGGVSLAPGTGHCPACGAKLIFPLLGPLFSSSSFGAVNRGLFVGFATHLGERTKGAVCFVADGRLLPVPGRATVDEPELKSGELS
jgi:hypothetical protein